MSVYLTQLIYIHPGQEEVFDAFEAVAVPLLTKYRGKLLLRGDLVRCDDRRGVRLNTKLAIRSNLWA
jgi:hypothetical protein